MDFFRSISIDGRGLLQRYRFVAWLQQSLRTGMRSLIPRDPASPFMLRCASPSSWKKHTHHGHIHTHKRRTQLLVLLRSQSVGFFSRSTSRGARHGPPGRDRAGIREGEAGLPSSPTVFSLLCAFGLLSSSSSYHRCSAFPPLCLLTLVCVGGLCLQCRAAHQQAQPSAACPTARQALSFPTQPPRATSSAAH